MRVALERAQPSKRVDGLEDAGGGIVSSASPLTSTVGNSAHRSVNAPLRVHTSSSQFLQLRIIRMTSHSVSRRSFRMSESG